MSRSVRRIVLAVLACTCAKPQTEVNGGNFSGTIGGRHDTWLVIWSHPVSFPALQGFELDRSSGSYLWLEGERSKDGLWRLSEFSEPSHVSGAILGRPSHGAFEGTWRPDGDAPPAPFRMTAIRQDPRVDPKVRRDSGDFAERAFRAASAKDFREAVFYLKLHRVTSHDSPHTEDWEALFQSELAGAASELHAKLSACDPRHSDCAAMQGPLAYLRAKYGDAASARRLYRTLCRRDPYTTYRPPFTCLMYAGFSESAGDRTGALEGYDSACVRGLLFACPHSHGDAEIRLIDDIKRGDSTAALRDLPLARNVNARSSQALDEAVRHGMTELVRRLLERGADPNLSDDNVLPSAILSGNAEMIRLLLDHGADPIPLALQAAVETRNLGIAEDLLRKGADVNYNDYVGAGTQLMDAVEDNNREMVRLLLGYGADPTQEAKFHDPILKSAKDPEIRRMLVRAIAECRTTRKCENAPER